MAEKNKLVMWPDAAGDYFLRGQTLTTTPGVNGWTLADTSAAGSPTAVTVATGGLALTLAATSEVEILTMYQNNVLIWDIRELNWLTFYAKVSGIDAVTTLTMGVGSNRNDTDDSVTANAWFRMEGSVSTSNLYCESDDTVTDNDDKSAGTTLSSTYKKFHIDFMSRNSSRIPTDIKFYVDNVRVATTTTFTMAGYSSYNVQPIIQLQKASGTGVPAVTIGWLQAQLSLMA